MSENWSESSAAGGGMDQRVSRARDRVNAGAGPGGSRVWRHSNLTHLDLIRDNRPWTQIGAYLVGPNSIEIA